MISTLSVYPSVVEKWKSVLLDENDERWQLVWQLSPIIVHYLVYFFVIFTMMIRFLSFIIEFALNCVCIYRPTSKGNNCVFGRVGLVSKTKWMLEKYYEKLISQISDTVTLICVDNFTISFFLLACFISFHRVLHLKSVWSFVPMELMYTLLSDRCFDMKQ